MITASLRFYGELNAHLDRAFRQRRLNISCPEQNTVRNVIGLLAVPATDVDLIIVNGEAVDFSYAVQPGDRISVYPLFRSIDISPLKKLHLLN